MELEKRTRNTTQRRAVLQIVRGLGGHPTAAEVFVRAREAHPQMSLATVYRSLHALVEQGEIGEARIENTTRYDVSPTPHAHAVCRLCGKVADVPARLSKATVRRLEESCGFALDAQAAQFSGLCTACRISPRA